MPTSLDVNITNQKYHQTASKTMTDYKISKIKLGLHDYYDKNINYLSTYLLLKTNFVEHLHNHQQSNMPQERETAD